MNTRWLEVEFDLFALLDGEDDEEFEQVVRDVPTAVLKKMLTEAVRTIRDYALPMGDVTSEAALHREIDLMLLELKSRDA